MSRFIKISDDTWKRLKRRAEPIDDNPNDIISKVLDNDTKNSLSSRVSDRVMDNLELRVADLERSAELLINVVSKLEHAVQVECPECERVLSSDDADFKRCSSCDPYACF